MKQSLETIFQRRDTAQKNRADEKNEQQRDSVGEGILLKMEKSDRHMWKKPEPVSCDVQVGIFMLKSDPV